MKKFLLLLITLSINIVYCQNILKDNFDNNSINTNIWNTKGTGVFQKNGIMHLEQNVIDEPMELSTNWMSFDGSKPNSYKKKIKIILWYKGV